MSSQVHRIELTARDGTRAAFDAIKRGATEDARALDQMGKTGSRAFGEVEKGATDAARAQQDYGRATRELGLGMAALGASFALASRSALDQSRQIDAINRLYGESADEIIALSEAIQDNTNFSNDAARQAAITGSTLASNYELSAEQIGVLIERSADLAQIHGVDLADAMTRVSGAIRGEGEAAELLGLNMSDSAVAAEAAARGLTGWTTSMTEAEKAAFRYTLVLEQTTATQGAAAEAADTTAGTVRHLANEVQDAAQSFAAWTGPVGESVAVLSDYALQIGLATAGVGQFASGLKSLIGAQRLATAGTAALNLAMGPVGLVAAAGLAAVAVYKAVEAIDDANLSAKEAEGEIAAFEETLARLGKSGAGTETLGNLAAFREVLERIVLDSESAETRLQGALSAATQRATEELEAQATGDAAALDAAHARTKAAEDYVKVIEETIINQEQLNSLSEDIVDIFTDMNPLNADLVIARVEELTQRWRDGKITADDYIDAIDDLNEHSDSYGLTIDEIAAGSRRAATATADLAKATGQTAEEAARSARRWKEYDDAIREVAATADRIAGRWSEYDTAIRAAAQADREKAAANRELIASMAPERVEEATRLERDTQKWNEYDAAVRAANDSRVQSSKDAQRYLDDLEAERGALEAGAVAGDSFASASEGVGDAQTELSQASRESADALREAESAMDRLARGSTSAGVALRAFKDIQDGIIADQGPFNRQLSEYNQQLDLLQNAEDLLNQRKAEGIALTAEQEDFLNRVDAAQARLEGGTEDATLALGYQALAYAENVRLGDQLNDTLSGTNGAVTNLSSSVDRLTAALIALSLIDATPTVAVSGLAEANAELGVVLARMAALDGSVASATVNVGANIDPRLSGVAGLFGGGGMVGAAQGRMVRVNEGGREMATLPTGDDVWLPNGTMVWPHAASTMGNRGKGAIPFTNYGSITIVANNPVEFGAHLRDYGLAGR